MSAALARKRWMQVSKKEKQRKRWEAMAASILKKIGEKESSWTRRTDVSRISKEADRCR